MAFHEDRLPVGIELGAIGGPGFKTIITTLTSGFERRNIDWEVVRGSWSIAYAVQVQTGIETVRDHFYAREGRAHGFPFKDWLDFQMGTLGTASTRQTIGTGDGVETDFQTFKRYTSGGFNYDRVLKKLVSGLEIYFDGVLKTITTDYTVDLTTGIITTVSAQAVDVLIEIICEFNVPVRYDTDKFDVSGLLFEDAAQGGRGLVGSIPQLDIVEIRIP